MTSCTRNPDSNVSAPLGWFVTALGCYLMRQGMGDGMLWCNPDARGEWGAINDESNDAPSRCTGELSLPDDRRLVARYSKGESA